MTTNPIHLSDGLEWRSPTNLKGAITNGEPARVRWPPSAERPMKDREIPWKYGYLVWDYWLERGRNGRLRSGKVRFLYGPDAEIDILNRGAVQVQREKKGIGR